ncbi:MAG: ATP-binding protein [Prevotella sp.]|jgi:predicted AAA+ superfamily ATPase|nr:ATP-binding protein [Prevotella sp.]MCI2081357.1 ATP-binding protein [Prevotella sp.]MCI2103217.1 ATP-binding protein [Prevotella sp.]
MERQMMAALTAWKDKKDRKPLILLGARQVGKTWILKEFGRRCFDNVAYINCDNNPQVEDLFSTDYNMDRIIMTISAITQQSIIPGKTLIILDEIQETRKGLASLKYFCENAPDYHVAVAGSLLGIQLHQGESYPAGKVDTLTLYPMDFSEFLRAKGEDRMADVLQSQEWDVISGLRSRFTQLLREYYFVGGMPEAVLQFVKTKDPNIVRKIQAEILEAYRKDVSKHAPVEEVVRINQVWDSIPSQLVKENKKFIYGVIKKGARAKEYEVAIQWLIDAGLVYRIPRVNAPRVPLKNYEDVASFKLFMLDCGLLGALSNTPPVSLLLPGSMEEGKGSFTENFVCTQMETLPQTTIAYFSRNDSQLEIDFVIQLSDMIIPIEVKAKENLKSKSLTTFVQSHPELHGLRFSMSDYREQDLLTNVPLYAAASFLRSLMKKRQEEIDRLLGNLI